MDFPIAAKGICISLSLHIMLLSDSEIIYWRTEKHSRLEFFTVNLTAWVRVPLGIEFYYCYLECIGHKMGICTTIVFILDFEYDAI